MAIREGSMSDRKSYYDLLKHPKWQKLRLKVMQKANFECQNCGSKDSTLHIHHSYYEKDKAPWEYPEDTLQCLCEDCHKEIRGLYARLDENIRRIKEIDTFCGGLLERLVGYSKGLEASAIPVGIIEISSYEMAWGIADCYGLTPEDIISALQDGTIDGYGLEELQKKKKKKK
jgi:hypothetical protein